jgi:hypothetical protein
MKSIKFLVCLLLISSCGGGGGGGGPSVPFALTLAQSFFSTDEDSIYTGSVAASANEPVTLEYSLTNSTSNGTLTFSQNAAITYTPNSNYFGKLTNNINKNINLNYEFSVNHNLDKVQYNSFGTTFSKNNFVTTFNYVEENGIIGSTNIGKCDNI